MCFDFLDTSILKLFHIELLYLRTKKKGDEKGGEKGRVGILHVSLDKPWSYIYLPEMAGRKYRGSLHPVLTVLFQPAGNTFLLSIPQFLI